jgi:hypothetical protein
MFSFYWLLGFVPKWLPWTIISFGVVLFLLEFFGRLFIPIFYRIPIKIIGVILVCGGFYIAGGYDALNEAEEEIQKLKNKQEEISNKIVEVYITKIEKVKETTNETIKQVNTKDDFMCDLPESFVRLHDAAAQGIVPDPTKGVDGASSGVALSEAEKVIIQNYGEYMKVSEQLKSLQEWVQQQKELNP